MTLAAYALAMTIGRGQFGPLNIALPRLGSLPETGKLPFAASMIMMCRSYSTTATQAEQFTKGR